MAWGLEETEHLVLLISGFGGTYPVLEVDGAYTSAARKATTKLSFKVGLSSRYKPSKTRACGAVREDGSIIDECHDQLEKITLGKKHLHHEDDKWGPKKPTIERQVADKEQPDRDHFDSFSLSNPLELLLNKAFVHVIQYRRRFGLGWAGADYLYQEIERSKQLPEEALSASFEVCRITANNPSLLLTSGYVDCHSRRRSRDRATGHAHPSTRPTGCPPK